MTRPHKEKMRKWFRSSDSMRSHFRYLFMGAVALAGVALVMMLVWNLVMPAIIGTAAITYWQALGLIILLRLTAGVLGFSRHRHVNSGLNRHRYAVLACDSHRII